MSARARPGSVIAYWEGGTLALGLLKGEEKGRLLVLSGKGKGARIQPSRVMVEVAPPGVDADPELCQRVEREVRAAADRVDVPALWEITCEPQPGRSDPPEFEPRELAELALGSGDGANRAAVVLALHEDRMHFVRKGDAWRPRPVSAVEQLRTERERVARRERETDELFESLRAVGRGTSFRTSGTETEARYVDALTQLAVHEDAAPTGARQLALEALRAWGARWDRSFEGAFRLLRQLGRFTDDDANLQVLRFGLTQRFPEELTDHARRVASQAIDLEGRTDLTAGPAVSIDSARTRELDDLIGVERRADGGMTVRIHIADPGAWVRPNDPLDAEALSRGLTHYMPDLRITMLPPEIAEHAASLEPGEDRPALSFLVELDAKGEIREYELAAARVRSTGRLTYDEADRGIDTGEGPCADLLAALDTFGERREALRAARGAVLLRGTEVDVHVAPDGTTSLERLEGRSPSRRGVTEAMVLAGELAARFCSERGIPIVYRRQEPAEPLPELPPGGISDPVSVRRVRRLLRRAEVCLDPRPHRSLGLDAYAQVTSPIRRYQDLVVQRQVVAALRGGPVPHGVEQLQRIAATTEQADSVARRAEQSANEYWLLRHLERNAGPLSAVVVDTEPRTIIRIEEIARERPAPGLTGVTLGERVRLAIERVNPRAGVLQLRRI